MMGAMIVADYMFFEQDHGMCYMENNKVKITLFECYVLGCLLPCTITLDQNSGGGGGAPPVSESIVR